MKELREFQIWERTGKEVNKIKVQSRETGQAG